MEKTMQDNKLVTYLAPTKPVRGERLLNILENALMILTFVSGLIILVWLIFGILNLASTVSLVRGFSFSYYEPFVEWSTYYGVLIPLVAAYAATEFVHWSAGKELMYYYVQVPQGKIVELTTRGGGESPLEWCIVLEGNNRTNQLRREEQPVNAGKWHDGSYVIGEYADFR